VWCECFVLPPQPAGHPYAMALARNSPLSRGALVHKSPSCGPRQVRFSYPTPRPAEVNCMNSRVHPSYKIKYHVTNWPEYERALFQRGDITVWLSSASIKAWNAKPSGRRGAPRKYSDLAIETALALQLVFHLPLRQTEGFLNSLFEMMGLDLSAPDHTTLSRRSKQLNIKLRSIPANGAIHLIVDSSGLSIVGEGEWASSKHGRRGKRGWKKLHIGVDQAGVIVAQELTDATGDDASTGLRLLDEVKPDIKSFTGDAAYDTLAIYEAAGARGARVVVPPFKSAVVSKRGPRSPARDRTIRRINKVGRRQWKKESGYHRQGTVENAFFRYKQLVGDRLRARHSGAQKTEAVIACNVLNRMLELGRPKSRAVAA